MIDFNPFLILARLLLNNRTLSWLFATIPELIAGLGLLMLYAMLNWFTLMVLILALVVRLMSWVQVQMRLITLTFVAIALLLMILEVVMEHAVVRILIFLNVASDLVFRVSGLLNIVLHVVILLVSDAVLDSQVSDLFWAQSLFLKP